MSSGPPEYTSMPACLDYKTQTPKSQATCCRNLKFQIPNIKFPGILKLPLDQVDLIAPVLQP